jgi:hypothetical protein
LMDINTYNVTLIVVGLLTWLVFILGVAKFSKFYLQFIVYRRELDTNLTGMGSGVKKLQNAIAEMILEQRRTNKLMLELIENGKAVIGDTATHDDNDGGDLKIEYQLPDAQNQDSQFIFHGDEDQHGLLHESEFIFHGNEDQHK